MGPRFTRNKDSNSKFRVIFLYRFIFVVKIFTDSIIYKYIVFFL